MASTMEAAAIAYIERVPVFPAWAAVGGRYACGVRSCKNIGKHPIGFLTPHSFLDASRDPAVVGAWWRRVPDANVATPTTWCWVLDVDSRHRGDETLAALEKAHGPLPVTPEVLTGGGGRHIYFQPVPGLRCGTAGAGLDVKASGGYVLLPPSTHQSGRAYADDLLAPLFETPLAPAPSWLLDRIRSAEAPPPRADGWIPIETVFVVPEKILGGQRHGTLFRLARSLKAKGVSREAAEAALVIENATKCEPPLDAEELRAYFQRAWKQKDRPGFDPSGNGASASGPEEAEQSEPEPAAPYTFTPAFPPDHFVSQFLAYGTQCVDCAHDYLETVALVALAVTTPGLRAKLRQYPRGLGTAFYAILIGDSTRSRKSTAAALGLDLLTDAVPDSQLAEQASPEAFVEQLAARSHDSTLWYCDELGETLDKLHHAKYMAGLRGLLLSLYDGRRYTYKRTTKRTKKGEPVEDSLVIEHPNLAVLGATTEAIFEIVTGRDVASGFLARYAVVMPTSRPPRRGLEESPADLAEQRHRLVDWLTRLYLWAKTGPRSVRFDGDALGIIDAFAEDIETSAALSNERARAMLQRLNAMTVKLALLAAAGRPDADDRDDLAITPEDARAAVAVATRWRDYATAFGERVGETALEQKIDRALRIVQVKKRAPRRVIAQLVHCSKKVMDDIESTLEDRGAIVVSQVEGKNGPATRVWTWVAP